MSMVAAAPLTLGIYYFMRRVICMYIIMYVRVNFANNYDYFLLL